MNVAGNECVPSHSIARGNAKYKVLHGISVQHASGPSPLEPFQKERAKQRCTSVLLPPPEIALKGGAVAHCGEASSKLSAIHPPLTIPLGTKALLAHSIIRENQGCSFLEQP